MNILVLARLYRRIRARRMVGVGVVLAMILVCIVGNALCFYAFDRTPENEFTFGDALWYSVISVTTIGYGDFSATSVGARLGTLFFIVFLGLSTFSVFLGMSIDWVSEMVSKGRRGMSRVIAENHVLIVNFPSRERVRQLIDEIKADPHHQNSEIILVADQIEELPFTDEHLLFVRGSVLEQETYQRAKVSQAKMAIVLATSYEDSSSDAVVASAIAVIDSLHPEIHIVAECLNHRHKMLFDSVHCDAIVYSMMISGNLLAQEAHDPGVSQLVETITSNVKGTTLYSTQVEENGEAAGSSLDYNDFAKRLLDRDVNLLCVNRGDDSLTSFLNLQPQAGDRIIYAADERRDWLALTSLAIE